MVHPLLSIEFCFLSVCVCLFFGVWETSVSDEFFLKGKRVREGGVLVEWRRERRTKVFVKEKRGAFIWKERTLI